VAEPATSDAPGDENTVLLLRARTDPQAFGEFYRRNLDALLAWLYRQTFCAELAADLTAETFAAALERLDRFDPSRGCGRAWLWGIAGMQLRRWWRRGAVDHRARQRLGIAALAVDEGAQAHVEALVDMAPYRAVLADALAELTHTEREAIELRVIRQMSYADISEQLGCAPGAARVRVSRALAHLRRMLDDSSLAWNPDVA
jgi:RNA polymerase sigma-70 factor (ECF subfamily)